MFSHADNIKPSGVSDNANPEVNNAVIHPIRPEDVEQHKQPQWQPRVIELDYAANIERDVCGLLTLPEGVTRETEDSEEKEGGDADDREAQAINVKRALNQRRTSSQSLRGTCMSRQKRCAGSMRRWATPSTAHGAGPVSLE